MLQPRGFGAVCTRTLRSDKVFLVFISDYATLGFREYRLHDIFTVFSFRTDFISQITIQEMRYPATKERTRAREFSEILCAWKPQVEEKKPFKTKHVTYECGAI